MERWYLATLLSLVLHQIDAAFWHEWRMFHVPGGIQGFLLFNLVAIGVLLRGYRQVVLKLPSARRYALLCGALGVATTLIHAGFAALGRDEFNLPLSLLALLACLLCGSALLLRSRPR
ncbi:MAG: DUF6713 family protein [Stenotrophomonas sp.]